METPREAMRVHIYVTEQERWHGRGLSTAIIDYLRQRDAAGVTVFRGIAGFGTHRTVHTLNIEALSLDLPLLIEWIDTPERVNALLPGISDMVTEGLITVEPVTIAKAARRDARSIPAHRTVAEVMTRDPVVIQEHASIRELAARLLGRHFHALPVVDRAGRLAGIVSDTDLVQRGGLQVRAELLPTLDAAARERELAHLSPSLTVADIMTREVVTVRPETTLGQAAHIMAMRQLTRLPVVDEDQQVVGIISRVDILRTASDPYRPGGEGPEAPPHAGARCVGDVMRTQVPTVHADDPLPAVLEAVIATRLHRAIVVDDGRRPIGIISDAELMRRLDPAAHASVVQVLMHRLPFVHPAPEEETRWRSQTGSRAADLMDAPAATVEASTPIPEAIARMVEQRHKILPVVDERGRLVGMVDRADLLRAMAIA
ncbi:MAG: DUF190 domain-containing protein [Sphaerobacter sp.]|nr:DUF190 domain-containing protein [Sphaerobacter sp.]